MKGVRYSGGPYNKSVLQHYYLMIAEVIINKMDCYGVLLRQGLCIFYYYIENAVLI